MQLIKKNILNRIFVGTLLVLCQSVIAQNNNMQGQTNNDVLFLDNNISEDTARRVCKHYPQIATLASAIIPGLGQAYNRKYWKVPLIWGAGVGLYTYFDNTNSYYHRYKLAYEQLEKKETVSDPDLINISKDGLYQGKEKYRHHRDMALIYMGLLYFANIVDAMVDAHMFEYDISQDLSLNWSPTIIPPSTDNYSNTTVGVYAQLKF